VSCLNVAQLFPFVTQHWLETVPKLEMDAEQRENKLSNPICKNIHINVVTDSFLV